MTPFQKFIAGLVTLVVCMGFVLACHALGYPLDKLVENGLLVGAAGGAGVGMWGGVQMPAPGQPPGQTPPPGKDS